MFGRACCPSPHQPHDNATPTPVSLHLRSSRALVAVLDMCGCSESCVATLAALAATPGAVPRCWGYSRVSIAIAHREDVSHCTAAGAAAAILAHMLGNEGTSRAVLDEPRAIEALVCGMGNRCYAAWAIAALVRAVARDPRAAAEVVRLWAAGAEVPDADGPAKRFDETMGAMIWRPSTSCTPPAWRPPTSSCSRTSA